jgi:hypothetical protein
LHNIDCNCFIVIADTDSYSGNFERPLVAYVTGRYGSCRVGEEEAELAERELGEDFIEDMPEILYFGEPCSRPATIWPGTSGGYTSVAWAYELMPSKELLGLFKERAAKFCEKNGISFKGLRVVRRKITIKDTVLGGLF